MKRAETLAVRMVGGTGVDRIVTSHHGAIALGRVPSTSETRMAVACPVKTSSREAHPILKIKLCYIGACAWKLNDGLGPLVTLLQWPRPLPQ